MRWSGKGLVEGDAITSTAIANTDGNGDLVIYGTSGTGGMSKGGDGIDVWGTASSPLRRLDSTAFTTSIRQVVTQCFYIPRQIPQVRLELTTVSRVDKVPLRAYA